MFVLTNLIITNSYFGQQTNRVMLIIRTHMKNIKMDTGYLNTGVLREMKMYLSSLCMIFIFCKGKFNYVIDLVYYNSITHVL